MFGIKCLSSLYFRDEADKSRDIYWTATFSVRPLSEWGG
jgi:hypothetical protein